MKIVILGSGGMGSVTLSKMIAQLAIREGHHVRSSEIHGMAKKGGLVEIHLKIGDYLSPLVSYKNANYVIILDEKYYEYGLVFNEGSLIGLSLKETKWIVNQFGNIRFTSVYMLGKFVAMQQLLSMDVAISIVSSFKEKEKNMKIFEEGMAYVI